MSTKGYVTTGEVNSRGTIEDKGDICFVCCNQSLNYTHDIPTGKIM